MKKPALLLIPTALLLSSCVTGSAGNNGWAGATQSVLNSGILNSAATAALSQSEIAAGLKQALEIGSTNVVGQLGVRNGFNADPKIRIPLPDTLKRVDSALSAIGMNSLTSDLENRLNSAAEAATPKAKSLFISAISQMTIRDAQGILTGPQDSATQYLRRTMGGQLANEMQPIIQNALNQAGAVQAYDQVMGQYGQIPFMPNVKADLQNYVTDRALDGIFYYVANEEAAIRQNPAKRTTELLRKVFANQ